MRIDTAVRGTAVAAGTSTGLVIAQQAMLPFGGRFTTLVLAVWILTSVTAAQCWLVRGVKREREQWDRREELILKTVAEITRPASGPRDTGPLRVVR